MIKIISQAEFASPEMKAKNFQVPVCYKTSSFTKSAFMKANNQILSDKLCAAYIVKYKHRTSKKRKQKTKNIFLIKETNVCPM